MSTEFTFDGNLTLKRRPEMSAILQDIREAFDTAHIEEEILDDKTADVWFNIYGTSHSHGEEFEDFCKRLEPFVVGAGSFDCENEGSCWTKYVGKPGARAKLISASALSAIETELHNLSRSDRAKLIAKLTRRKSK